VRYLHHVITRRVQFDYGRYTILRAAVYVRTTFLMYTYGAEYIPRRYYSVEIALSPELLAHVLTDIWCSVDCLLIDSAVDSRGELIDSCVYRNVVLQCTCYMQLLLFWWCIKFSTTFVLNFSRIREVYKLKEFVRVTHTNALLVDS